MSAIIDAISKMTLQDWGAFATGIGVVISLIMSIVTIRELNTERREKQQPRLYFEHQGIRVKYKEVSSRIIESLTDYGTLTNFGIGSALNVRVIWRLQKITMNGEGFTIDAKKRSEKSYSERYNTLPAKPVHLLPGKTASLRDFPNFLKEQYSKIEGADGTVIITCTDALGLDHTFKQFFHINVNRHDLAESVVISFNDNHLSRSDEHDAIDCPDCAGTGEIDEALSSV